MPSLFNHLTGWTSFTSPNANNDSGTLSMSSLPNVTFGSINFGTSWWVNTQGQDLGAAEVSTVTCAADNSGSQEGKAWAFSVPNVTQGYQTLGFAGITSGTASGLAGGFNYTLNVALNGAPSQAYTITPTAGSTNTVAQVEGCSIHQPMVSAEGFAAAGNWMRIYTPGGGKFYIWWEIHYSATNGGGLYYSWQQDPAILYPQYFAGFSGIKVVIHSTYQGAYNQESLWFGDVVGQTAAAITSGGPYPFYIQQIGSGINATSFYIYQKNNGHVPWSENSPWTHYVSGDAVATGTVSPQAMWNTMIITHTSTTVGVTTDEHTTWGDIIAKITAAISGTTASISSGNVLLTSNLYGTQSQIVLSSPFFMSSSGINLWRGASGGQMNQAWSGFGGSIVGTLSFPASTNYYCYYDRSSGHDPALAGKTAIKVSYATNDTAITLATNTVTALQAVFPAQVLTVTRNTNVITLTNDLQGPLVDPGNNTTSPAFTITVTQQGNIGTFHSLVDIASGTTAPVQYPSWPTAIDTNDMGQFVPLMVRQYDSTHYMGLITNVSGYSAASYWTWNPATQTFARNATTPAYPSSGAASWTYSPGTWSDTQPVDSTHQIVIGTSNTGVASLATFTLSWATPSVTYSTSLSSVFTWTSNYSLAQSEARLVPIAGTAVPTYLLVWNIYHGVSPYDNTLRAAMITVDPNTYAITAGTPYQIDTFNYTQNSSGYLGLMGKMMKLNGSIAKIAIYTAARNPATTGGGLIGVNLNTATGVVTYGTWTATGGIYNLNMLGINSNYSPMDVYGGSTVISTGILSTSPYTNDVRLCSISDALAVTPVGGQTLFTGSANHQYAGHTVLITSATTYLLFSVDSSTYSYLLNGTYVMATSIAINTTEVEIDWTLATSNTAWHNMYGTGVGIPSFNGGWTQAFPYGSGYILHTNCVGNSVNYGYWSFLTTNYTKFSFGYYNGQFGNVVTTYKNGLVTAFDGLPIANGWSLISIDYDYSANTLSLYVNGAVKLTSLSGTNYTTGQPITPTVNALGWPFNINLDDLVILPNGKMQTGSYLSNYIASNLAWSEHLDDNLDLALVPKTGGIVWVQGPIQSSMADNAWHVIGNKGEPTFNPNWTNLGGASSTAAFRKDLTGTIHLRGVVTGGTIGSNIYVLPTGYLPLTQLAFAVTSNAALGQVLIKTDGSVYAAVGNTASVYLDGISFVADSNIWVTGTGSGGGTAGYYSLPPATAATLGGVIIGSNITVAGDGTISVPAPYVLPQATSSALGGVIVGSGINVSSGTISVTPYSLPASTASVLGGVKIGANVNVAGDGTISVAASSPSLGSYINSTFEIDTSTWASSNAALTYIRNTTNPLAGLGDMALAKDAANRQNQYWYYAITLDNVDAGGLLSISFDYRASGTYAAAGDFTVTLYDVTNSVTLIPTVAALPIGVGKFYSVVSSNSTSTSYQLRINVAVSTATAETYNIDNVVVQGHTSTQGSAISGWTAYTPTFSSGTPGTNTLKAQWRRVGNMMDIDFIYNQTGTGTTGGANYYVSIPTGYTIDTTNLTLDDGSTQNGTVLGYGSGKWSGQNGARAVVTPYSTTQLALILLLSLTSNNGAYLTYWGYLGGGFGATQTVQFTCSIPIAQWTTAINLVTDFTEYAFNTSTTATGNDTTSFGYGSQGNSFGAITGALSRRVRFVNPIQATDLITVECSADGLGWVPAASGITDSSSYFISSYNVQGSPSFGFGLYKKINSTDIDVTFGQYSGNSGGAFGSAGFAWSIANTAGCKWRVRKTSKGNFAEAQNPPPGVVWEYGGTVAPYGFLMCDGTSYLRTDYPALFNAIGTAFGSVDGTHFNVPDHREAAGVGIGTRASGVASHDIYTLGQFNDDQLQDHTQSVGSNMYGYQMGGFNVNVPAGSNAGIVSLSATTITTGRHGTTTHGKRLGMNYIIKI